MRHRTGDGMNANLKTAALTSTSGMITDRESNAHRPGSALKKAKGHDRDDEDNLATKGTRFLLSVVVFFIIGSLVATVLIHTSLVLTRSHSSAPGTSDGSRLRKRKTHAANPRQPNSSLSFATLALMAANDGSPVAAHSTRQGADHRQ